MDYNYEDVIMGNYEMNDWKFMTLKVNLEEGKDYVLVSENVWYVEIYL